MVYIVCVLHEGFYYYSQLREIITSFLLYMINRIAGYFRGVYISRIANSILVCEKYISRMEILNLLPH